MAAKKKSDQGKSKPKGRPSSKKASPKAKPEEADDLLDDDFGLDDIELDPVENSSEDKKAKSAPKKTTKTTKATKATDSKKEPKPEPKKEPMEKEDPAKVEKEEEKAEPFVFTTGEKEAVAQENTIEETKASKMAEKKKQDEKKEKKRSVIIIIVILLFLAILAVLLYFFVFKTDKAEPVETVPIEQAPAPAPKPEPKPAPEPAPIPEPAQLFNISTLGGDFYVIVGSFFDGDLAEDKAKAIVADGRNAYVIQPTGNFNFHRVGIAKVTSLEEAFQKRASLIEEFGESIWVMKF